MNLSEITQQMGEVGKTLSDSVPGLLNSMRLTPAVAFMRSGLKMPCAAPLIINVWFYVRRPALFAAMFPCGS